MPLVRNHNTPYFVIEYSPDYIVLKVPQPGGKSKLIEFKKGQTVSDLIAAYKKRGIDKTNIAEYIKLTQYQFLRNVIDVTDVISSKLPGDIGKKLSSVTFKDSINSCSTLELQFTKLTKDEADYVCFNVGATFRLFAGRVDGFGGKKNVYCVFEGCVQTSQMSYEEAGISIVLLLASHKYTKISYYTPFNLFYSYNCIHNSDTPHDQNISINTFRDFLDCVSKYLGLKRDPIIQFNSKNEELIKGYKRIFGYLDDTTDAQKFWDYLRISMNSEKQKIVNNANVQYWISIKDVLDTITGMFKLNWYLTSYGELFFGLLRQPDSDRRTEYNSDLKKVFWYRPFVKSIIPGITEKLKFDFFKSFDLIDLKEPKSEEPDTNELDYIAKKVSDPNNGLSEELKANVFSTILGYADENLLINPVEVEVVVKQITGMLTDAGVDTKTFVKDGISKEIDNLRRSSENDLYNKVNMIGKITGAVGDPLLSIGNTFYFYGAKKHTGYYFITEIEHKWSVGQAYLMDIIGTKPSDKEPLPSNLLEEEALNVIKMKTTAEEQKELNKQTIEALSGIKGGEEGLLTNDVPVVIETSTETNTEKTSEGD